METEPSSAGAAGSSSSNNTEKVEALKKAEELLAQGKRNMVCGEVPKAVVVFEEAVQLLVQSCGELSRDCADAYFSCGSAVLELARMETDVLGAALDGVDVEEEKDEEPNEKFEKPGDEEDEERVRLRAQVYEAMTEEQRLFKSAQSSNVDPADCLDQNMAESKETGDNIEQGVTGQSHSSSQQESSVSVPELKDLASRQASVALNPQRNELAETSSDGVKCDVNNVEVDGGKSGTSETVELENNKMDLGSPCDKPGADASGKSECSERGTATEDEAHKSVVKSEHAERGTAAEDDAGDGSERGTATKGVSDDCSLGKSEHGERGTATKDDASDGSERKTATVDAAGDGIVNVATSEVAAVDNVEGDSSEDEGDNTAEEKADDGEEVEGGEGTGEEAEGGEKDDDVPNFQLAWEYLDLAKVIYLKSEETEDQLRAAECHLKLGELSMETEQPETAAEDIQNALKIQQKLLPPDDRRIAETHYQLGLAYCLGKDFASSIKHYTEAISVIEAKIVSLNKLAEEENDSGDNKENRGSETLKKFAEEIKELQELIPDMKNKIEDTKEEARDMDKMKQMAKEALGFSSPSKSAESPTKRSAASLGDKVNDVDENGETKATDIGHLVRKKRKPETEAQNETKKTKVEDSTPPKTNGLHSEEVNVASGEKIDLSMTPASSVSS